MTKWKDLLEYTDTVISRGALLKFPAGQSFEDEVVMMVCEAPDKSGRFGLMAITGYKAGINCYVIFPAEAAQTQLSASWLIANWTMWVWPDGHVQDVKIRAPLEAQEL